MPLKGLSQSDWGWIISTKKVGAANAVPTFSCGDIDIHNYPQQTIRQEMERHPYSRLHSHPQRQQ